MSVDYREFLLKILAEDIETLRKKMNALKDYRLLVSKMETIEIGELSNYMNQRGNVLPILPVAGLYVQGAPFDEDVVHT